MHHFLFSYGTLQEDKMQLEIFGRLLEGKSDRLYGFKLDQIEIKDEVANSAMYFIAYSSEDSSGLIEGIVFELTDSDLILADEYEGEHYKRIIVKLETGVDAWVYVAV